MSNWNSAEEALDFAITNEQRAADFYTVLARRATNVQMAKTFEGFAKEELGHKAKLQAVRDGKKILPAEKKILDLKIGDYLVDVEATDDMTYQDSLILAMKREKAAFRLYTDLAAQVDDAELKNLFLGLAQEEAKHKLRFEVEYDDKVLIEN